ncbi:MAG: hypothetical protein GKR89_34245 [Candidatus Latescibacteria bacterium]|nr:hypothetical protein [Candidatus Latescibacterota bacterium]
MALKAESRERLLKRLETIRDVSKRRALINREGLDGDEAKALLDEAHFRTRGREKFPRAKDMRFTREGLAQASSKAVAEYRTWKMRQQLGAINRVLDVGAGIGGDTIALALRWGVVAVEKDPGTVELLRHNLDVYGVADNVEIVGADIRQWLQTDQAQGYRADISCVFFDPSRRASGRRVVSGEEYEPPLELIEELRQFCPDMGVKISPLTELSDISYDCDIEVISHKGTVRDMVLWFGRCKLAPDTRAVMATKLPERVTLVQRPGPRPKVGAPLQYLYEPDPAFTKAHLVDVLATAHGLQLLDRDLGYLTGAKRLDEPVFKRYEICQLAPFDYGEISRRLVALNMGQIDFKARGVGIDLRVLHQRIKGRGKRRGVVVLTRVAGRKQALICRYDGATWDK